MPYNGKFRSGKIVVKAVKNDQLRGWYFSAPFFWLAGKMKMGNGRIYLLIMSRHLYLLNQYNFQVRVEC